MKTVKYISFVLLLLTFFSCSPKIDSIESLKIGQELGENQFSKFVEKDKSSKSPSLHKLVLNDSTFTIVRMEEINDKDLFGIIFSNVSFKAINGFIYSWDYSVFKDDSNSKGLLDTLKRNFGEPTTIIERDTVYLFDPKALKVKEVITTWEGKIHSLILIDNGQQISFSFQANMKKEIVDKIKENMIFETKSTGLNSILSLNKSESKDNIMKHFNAEHKVFKFFSNTFESDEFDVSILNLPSLFSNSKSDWIGQLKFKEDKLESIDLNNQNAYFDKNDAINALLKIYGRFDFSFSEYTSYSDEENYIWRLKDCLLYFTIDKKNNSWSIHYKYGTINLDGLYINRL